jgi:predicted nuclease with TOPRIM domain
MDYKKLYEEQLKENELLKQAMTYAGGKCDEVITKLEEENEKLKMKAKGSCLMISGLKEEIEELEEKVKELTTHKNILLLETTYGHKDDIYTSELVKIAKEQLSDDDFEEWKEWYEVNDDGENVEE